MFSFQIGTSTKSGISNYNGYREEIRSSKTPREKEIGLFLVFFFKPHSRTVNIYHHDCAACVRVTLLILGTRSLIVSRGSSNTKRQLDCEVVI